MGTITTIVSLLGLGLASSAFLLLGKVSALAGGASNVQLLGSAILAFLFGIFLFSWALGKRTQY